jgi:hypothetical protein
MRPALRSSSAAPPGVPDNFAVHFSDLSSDSPQDPPALFGQKVVLARARASILARCALEPSMTFHSLQKRIERARTDLVAMATQFADDPLPIDRAIPSMVENVDFPKAE